MFGYKSKTHLFGLPMDAHTYTKLQRIYKPLVTVRMEYQVVTLINICQRKLTHLTVIRQQLPCFYCQTLFVVLHIRVICLF